MAVVIHVAVEASSVLVDIAYFSLCCLIIFQNLPPFSAYKVGILWLDIVKYNVYHSVKNCTFSNRLLHIEDNILACIDNGSVSACSSLSI